MIEQIPLSLKEAALKAARWKGLQTDRTPNFTSYDQVERFVGSLLTDVMLWQPEAVVAIVRGGLVPGTMTSCMLALSLFMVSWDRTTDVTVWIGQPPDARRVVLVDDCCATGRTMASVRASLLAQGYDCRTMTILHDPETTRYVPDYLHPMTALFPFPWERGEATPAAARRMRATGLLPIVQQSGRSSVLTWMVCSSPISRSRMTISNLPRRHVGGTPLGCRRCCRHACANARSSSPDMRKSTVRQHWPGSPNGAFRTWR
ncbi:MAG: hypothetical protein QOF70_7963 [Acetobacteraceae bacterium]|jgi:hypoxanthine phosphoribosyltransferase|nr:hypothetical protein [Acetobacteraceae bacterium]